MRAAASRAVRTDSLFFNALASTEGIFGCPSSAGIADRVALEKRDHHKPNYASDDNNTRMSMQLSRRGFLSYTALGSLAIVVKTSNGADGYSTLAKCRPDQSLVDDRLAAAEASNFRPYRSKLIDQSDAVTWMQIDLGKSVLLEVIRLYPAARHLIAGDGFPLRFRLEISNDSDFKNCKVVVDHSGVDYPNPENRIVGFKAGGVRGQFVRLTVTRFASRKTPSDFLQFYSEDEKEKISRSPRYVSLAKIEVLSFSGIDLAVGRSVTVDEINGNSEEAGQLTRPVRPMGEGILTNNPENVTDPKDWKPVANRARPPVTGVTVSGSLFKTVAERNVRYLLSSSSADDLLRPFRLRAGKKVGAPDRASHPFWDEMLPGSGAGRFLMGAANTLRWLDDAQLRERMNAVIDGIAECQEADGHMMPYPQDTFFKSERGAYARAWLTHGLLDAAHSGNDQALALLRRYYDWYNRHPKKAEMLRGCIQGGQGMVANTRLYFTRAGIPTDIQTIQQYFQENYWLEQLMAGNPDAFWQYPYDRPHSYLITNLEAYLDLYRATGAGVYLNAVHGAWKLLRENWQCVGGSFSIIELAKNIPKSNPLYENVGETCGSAFWILLNQRLHSLDPTQERYASEIERTIYNVIIANQGGSHGIRYYTRLVGHKSAPLCENSCCEGQGTRILGSLPEFIFSVSDDGLYLNLFEASSIRWQCNGVSMVVQVQTTFPETPEVELHVFPERPVHAKIYIRMPSWASAPMAIGVNGVDLVVGTPGSYAVLDRIWRAGDRVSFTLSIAFKVSKYEGTDQVVGRERFALEYGPLLMSALNLADERLVLPAGVEAHQIGSRLHAISGEPLHFEISTAQGRVKFIPYYEIHSETFSSVPIVETQPVMF